MLFYKYTKKLLGLTFLIAFFIAIGLLFIPANNSQSVLVEINSGNTAADVSENFYKSGVLRNKYVLRFALRLSGLDKRMVVGEFELPSRVTAFHVIKTITNSKNIYSRKLTIPEGYTVQDVVEVVCDNPYLVGSLKQLMPLKEGTLMPSTYYFPKGTTRESLIKRMQDSMQTYLNDLWSNRSSDLPYTSAEQALTLASIVEKETSIPEERRLIAGVFINRLKQGMRLQTDPTVAYGLGLKSAKGLTLSQLAIKTPYNTYKIKGLPPGPIANPGKASLYAVFYPEKTNYLYFVANGSGGHAFADNLKEHINNVNKWRKIEQVGKEQERKN